MATTLVLQTTPTITLEEGEKQIVNFIRETRMVQDAEGIDLDEVCYVSFFASYLFFLYTHCVTPCCPHILVSSSSLYLGYFTYLLLTECAKGVLSSLKLARQEHMSCSSFQRICVVGSNNGNLAILM